MKLQTKSINISIMAITGALYVALGLLFQPISFLGLQFRIAEVIVGMALIFPIPALIGKIIGVFFVNLFSPLGLIDLLSVLVNVPAIYSIIVLRNRKITLKWGDSEKLQIPLKYLGGLLYAIMISLYVAIILNIILGLPFLLMFIQVFISELILAELGIVLFSQIKKQLNLEEVK